MKRTTVATMLIVSFLLAGTQAFGWPGGQGPRGGQDCGQRPGLRMNDEQHQQRQEQQFEKMAIILDLTESQKQELQTLREKQQQQQQTRRAEMQASREKLHSAATGSDFNEAEFRTIAQQHANLKTEMMVEGAKSRRQMMAVLSPEQQQKAEELRDLGGAGSFGKQGHYKNCADGEGGRGQGPGQRSNCRGGQGPRF